MEPFTKEEVHNLLALISNVSIQAKDAKTVADLIQKLTKLSTEEVK
jgi:hypothetical protein